jgi:membrane protease YdiL (CAAX protease family)
LTVVEPPGGPPLAPGSRRPPSPLEGLLLLSLSALLFWGGALLILRHDGILAYAILPAAAFLLPSVAWAEIREAVDVAFPSRLPSIRGAAASASLLAGASLLALALAGAISGAPGSSREEEALRSLVLGVPGPARLLLFALLPALCEELLFRGALLACLRPWGKWRAVLASALAFALFHGSPVRFAPVALLGAALALAVWETGNLWIAVAGHAAHNGLILLALSSGEAGSPPTAATTALLAVGGVSLALLWLWWREDPPGLFPAAGPGQDRARGPAEGGSEAGGGPPAEGL